MHFKEFDTILRYYKEFLSYSLALINCYKLAFDHCIGLLNMSPI